MKKIPGILILLTIFLSACSGGGGATPGTTNGTTTSTGTPTDPTIDFSIFPSNYFTSYDVAADLSGIFSGGISGDEEVTGNITEKVQAQSTFSAQAAIPVLTTITFTSAIGIGGTALLTDYYSIDADNRLYLGSDIDDGNIISNTALIAPTVIPKTARIGDSGNIGQYVSSDDFDESTVTWKLEDGFNGNARLIILNKTNKASGTPDNTATTTYLIQPDGTRLSIELVTFNETVKITNTLSGDYN